MTNVDIRALAKLARLDISDAEVEKLEREIPPILAFVEQIQKVEISGGTDGAALRNVMREDADPHETGAYTEKLIGAAPVSRDGRVVVRQVISRKKK